MSYTQSLTPEILPWDDPLDLAAGLMNDSDHLSWILLYSAVKTTYSGRYSYLAYDVKDKVESTNFELFSTVWREDLGRFDEPWFGYLGYGLKNSLEDLATDEPGWLKLPPLYMIQFSTVLVFDHEKQHIERWSRKSGTLPVALHASAYPLAKVSGIRSNMSNETYLQNVAKIISHIHRGDFYQANLTRKFFGTWENVPDPFSTFRQLCAMSPAPYSAFMRLDNRYVLSSSPELFLSVDNYGNARTRPIKGTAARYQNEVLDKKSREQLSASNKDRAENLMIVDLMRNDLAKSCAPGSVRVSELFEITSHTSVHHMSSTVTGKRRPENTTLELIKHCFPPGSMTGAPKIRAMQICSEIECVDRGIYSGALGWLGSDGACELSVVIRTLLIKGNEFEFRVGGGIVADSSPSAELAETIDKSKGILKVLGLSEESVFNL